jgi:hypothetical protein
MDQQTHNNINDAAALDIERLRLQSAWFTAKRAAMADGLDVDAAIRAANEQVDESTLYAPADSGEVFYVGNGGEWRTSGGMATYVTHSPTKYVRLQDGTVRYAK